MGHLNAVALLFWVAAGPAWLAAQGSNQAVSFEVASIKPIQPPLAYPNFFVEIDRLRGNHVTAAMVVAAAYGVERSQIIGGPGWIDTERFDIDARAASPLPAKTERGYFRQPLTGIVRQLLADRFRFRMQQQTRGMEILALTVVQPDRMNARIRPAKADCTRIQTQLVLAPDEDAKRGLFGQCFERSTGSESNVRGQPIGRLADRISGSLRRLVIDDTGVQGNVDLTLIWDFTTDRAQSNAWMLVALEEQLGLKVVSRRVAMPIVVIERIARPSPN